MTTSTASKPFGVLAVFFILLAPFARGGAEATPTGPTGATKASAVEVRFVAPSKTDPKITQFDRPHRIYLRHDDAKAETTPANPRRGELLLWLPGTAPENATAAPDPTKTREGADGFCQLAAELGYHVISLHYPNALSASAARRDDADEFERFRLAIIRGGSSRHIDVSRTDSIENRLIKLLTYLASQYPAEAWGKFLGDGQSINWEKIALAGQSQGGGHAALIASHHRVLRVICTGAPKDYNVRSNRPAAWLLVKSATPRSRFFAFNHLQDRQAASFDQQMENLRAMKLDAFGPLVNVDQSEPPYRHTRMLTTNYPGGSLESGAAHTSVISWRNAAVFDRVWRYMLTEPVE
jgi:pimeloyl-ACP methyl ester carboxylesterase